MTNIIEIHQQEQAITNSSDKKPVLATFGLACCVAITGYDGENRTGFLTHYDHSTNIEASIDQLLRLIPTQNIEVQIVGGETGISEGLIARVRGIINNKGIIIVREDILGEELRSISLDTRTGATHHYKPKSYKPRKQRASMSPQPAALIYSSIKN